MSKRAPTVYAFMDESGDPGGALEFGASPHFIVVMLETTEPEFVRDELKKLRFKLNLPQAFEFWYHDTQMPWARAESFKLFRSLDVRVRAALIDKTQLGKDFVFGQHALYKLAVGGLVLRASPAELSDAVLVIDGKHGAPTNDLLAALRQHSSRLCEKQQPK